MRSLKTCKIWLILLSVLMAAGLCACSGNKAAEKTDTEPTESEGKPASENNGIISIMNAQQEDLWKSFEAAPPVAMFITRSGGIAGLYDEWEHSDRNTINMIYEELSLIEPGEKVDIGINDGIYIGAEFFSSDGDSIAIGFEEEYLYFDGSYYEYEGTTSALKALVDEDEEKQAREEAQTDPGEKSDEQTVTLTSYSLEYDWNMDGEDETIDYEFYRNGDEAPDSVTFIPSWDTENIAWINNCYEILDAYAVNDGEEAFVVLICLCGDYYSHDSIEEFKLYFDEGTLSVGPAKT